MSQLHNFDREPILKRLVTLVTAFMPPVLLERADSDRRAVVLCHYETLDISPNATQDEIRRAFYRQCLKWHPDRNPDNIQEATAKIQDVNRAYKILGNQKRQDSRSWYDKYKDQILSDLNRLEPLYNSGLLSLNAGHYESAVKYFSE